MYHRSWIQTLTIALGLCFTAYQGQAHPVIYKDGFVYWGQYRSQANTQRFSYTFHPNFSLEANSEYYGLWDDYRDYKAGINVLAKRWLFAHSQANVYLSAHGGYFEQENEDGLVGHAKLEADWESRRFYTATAASVFYRDSQWEDQYRLRLGLAPYLGDMETLQTWFVVQADYFEEQKNEVVITPMMRFFYQNVLWELGSSLKGDFFLTLMFHY